MNFDEEPWRLRGACRGYDPTLWTEDTAVPYGRQKLVPTEREQIAKYVCWMLCPVRSECEAASTGLPGIWGGRDEYERSQGRRMRPSMVPEEIREALTSHTRYIHDLRAAQTS